MKSKRAVLLVVVFVLGVSAAAFVVYNNQKHKNQAASSSSSSQNAQKSHTNSRGKPLTVTGKMTCLKPKDSSGPQTEMCAIGIVGDDGNNYALSADDPTLTGSVPTGQQVKVTGQFTEKTTQYDMAGTIYVTLLELQ